MRRHAVVVAESGVIRDIRRALVVITAAPTPGENGNGFDVRLRVSPTIGNPMIAAMLGALYQQMNDGRCLHAGPCEHATTVQSDGPDGG